ncbi:MULTISPECIES: hypothetical protein [unclassified Rhodococcus (in: high G+C Gram-positive bacteria)]|uniref:hypothetical protein n=1 Tax=unclassified Rhodococcus (in: high G+C Gram-positive bacteria) TaxID=192944 RepID=UPI00163AC0DD|nr:MULTISPECIES: hypothetical protein [unclassified Rhodococcus (in: high G+C Gram-positive bacteria)]MBC2638078.1 hypothetical protein [Rhodococcus sp. 3A]MBC2897175.1 hypothetical protein [Rhodococcus sp. 4CII]
MASAARSVRLSDASIITLREIGHRVHRPRGHHEDNILSKLVRDLNIISARGVMSEAGFESDAEVILGLQNADNRRMV